MKTAALLQQILTSAAPGDALKASLCYGGFAALPCLANAADIPAGPAPYHSGSVLDHTARCMNWTAGDPIAVWMAMVHDCGKLTTPKEMWPHHYGHEQRGESLAAMWGAKLGLDHDYIDGGAMAAALHMRAARYPIMRPGKKLKILKDIWATPWADSFLKVVEADSRSKVGRLLAAHHKALLESGETDEDSQIRLLASLAKKDPALDRKQAK